MGKRRANNEGCITKRKDGKWMARLKIGMEDNGKAKYSYMYANTQQAVIEKMNDLKLSLNMGIDVAKGDITVEQWLKVWMEKYKQNLKPTTKTSYYNNIRLHINPFIGGVRLNKLETGQIQYMLKQAYNSKKNRTKTKNEKSTSLFFKVYSVINGAMKQAVKNKMVKNNPCDDIVFPPEERKEVRVFTLEEQRAFEMALTGETYRVLYMTYLYTGARLGELPALTWKDINFDMSYIDLNKKAVVVHDYYKEGKKTDYQVQDYLKSKSSKRKVYITNKLVDILKEEKERQQLAYAEFGWEWSEENLVFPSGAYTMLDMRNIQTMFQRIRDKAEISHGTMHTLRHTYATRCFESDIDIKVISEQLGHKNVKTTYDTYVHVMPEKKKLEMEKLNVLDQLVV